MVLILSAILSLKSCQVNYTQAFPQAPLDDPIFMRIPQGWTYNPMQQQIVQSDDPKSIDRDYFICLQCNLYGYKQAAQKWYLHLKASLEARGFIPSKIDPCLYIRNDCIIALYTDDCLILQIVTRPSISCVCHSVVTSF